MGVSLRLNHKVLKVLCDISSSGNDAIALIVIAQFCRIFFQSVRVLAVLGSLLVTAMNLTPGAAAQQHLKETVVTATRIPVIAEQIGSPISVIDQEAIARMQHRSLADALRHVPGLHSVPIGSSGHQTSLFVRGAASNHVLVLVDGIEVSDPSASSGAFDFGNLFIGTDQKIEILRGPQASMYGSEAIGGVINVITDSATVDRVSVRSDGGSFGTFNQFASITRVGKNNKWRIASSISHHKSHGQSLTANRFAPANSHNEADGFENFSGSFRLDLNAYDAIDLKLVTHVIDTKAELDPTAEDPDSDSTASQYFVRLEGSSAFLDSDIMPKLGIAISHISREFFNYPDSLANTFQSTQDTGRRIKVDGRVDLLSIDNHLLTAGIEYEHEKLENTQFANFSGFVIAGNAGETAATKTIYLQDVYSWRDRVFITADVRYDDNTRAAGLTTYRISPVLLLSKFGTRLRGGYGTGHRAPALFELFGDATTAIGKSFQGNRNLRSEKSTSWEVGFDQPLGQDNIVAGFTYFESDIKDLIVASGFPTIPNNVRDAEIRGIELLLSLKEMFSFAVTSAYTFTSAENKETGGSLLRRPKHKLDIDVTWRPIAGFHLSSVFQYIGEISDPGFNGTAVHRGGYSLMHLRTERNFPRQNLSIFARVDNLFDNSYEVADGFRGQSRGLFVGLEKRF